MAQSLIAAIDDIGSGVSCLVVSLNFFFFNFLIASHPLGKIGYLDNGSAAVVAEIFFFLLVIF